MINNYKPLDIILFINYYHMDKIRICIENENKQILK